jgi:hypothetical protein
MTAVALFLDMHFLIAKHLCSFDSVPVIEPHIMEANERIIANVDDKIIQAQEVLDRHHHLRSLLFITLPQRRALLEAIENQTNPTLLEPDLIIAYQDALRQHVATLPRFHSPVHQFEHDAATRSFRDMLTTTLTEIYNKTKPAAENIRQFPDLHNWLSQLIIFFHSYLHNCAEAAQNSQLQHLYNKRQLCRLMSRLKSSSFHNYKDYLQLLSTCTAFHRMRRVAIDTNFAQL